MRSTYIALGTVLAAVLAGPVQADDKLSVYLDRKLSASAEDTCTPGFIWQGSGNPNSNFQRKRNEEAGIELGIKGILRTGPDRLSTYVDNKGLVHIEVPAGPQPGSPTRAAWNFTYSIDVSLDPSNPTLDQYKGELWIDLDPSDKTDYLKLDLARIGSPVVGCAGTFDGNGFGWKAKGATIIPDDEGTDRVTQNSQNLGFYPIGNTFGPGQFDVVLKVKRKSGGPNDETELHVVFDVVTGGSSQTP